MEAHQRKMEASQTGKAHLHSGSKPTFGSPARSGSLESIKPGRRPDRVETGLPSVAAVSREC